MSSDHWLVPEEPSVNFAIQSFFISVVGCSIGFDLEECRQTMEPVKKTITLKQQKIICINWKQHGKNNWKKMP